MIPFAAFLPILYALGYLFGAFVCGPLAIPGDSWYGITFAAVVGVGVTWLAQRYGLVSRYFLKSDR